MFNKMKKIVAIALACAFTLPVFNTFVACDNNSVEEVVLRDDLVASYSFESVSDYKTYNSATENYDKVNYIYSLENQQYLVKEASEPLLKQGVSGKSLYMDGFSVNVEMPGFQTPTTGMTLSAWVAPRVFENLAYYGDASDAKGHPRLTSVISQGDIEVGQGFCFGYGRLGMWGLQMALYNYDSMETFVIAFYDPINTLTMYQWSHIAATFDGDTGYIALFFNGEKAYEDIIPELVNTEIVENDRALLVGAYENPQTEFSMKRQMPAGLLDEVRVYDGSKTPSQVKAMYDAYADNAQNLDYSQVALDSSVYEGDRYRPQYHAIPPAVWMNEPHAPFYYKGMYHVFYQCNPSGPYWMQIRWGHIVSEDMIHWKHVKDAVVPTAGICPEGVWTGGACIGPDGTPWLAITAGTNLYGNPNNGGQNVAFAHAVDPNDPYLTDWVVEDTLIITQTNDGSMGEREQFRDPFVWYDDETELYYMLVSTSIIGAGGSANVYTSENMREWDHHGFLYECPYPKYDIAGEHWECVIMLPISNADGSIQKYILFDCPQYARGENAPKVECYYWIGTFDKNTCRFIADNDEPQLFDIGTATYTGQTGFCYLTEEQVEKGMTYEQGRTVIYSIAQGKDAGTALNYYAGWAHNFAFPLELTLTDDGKQVIRKPISEISSLYGETLYEYEGEGMTAAQVNDAIANVRGDTIKIDISFELAPTAQEFSAKIGVRYNLTQATIGTERTFIDFSNGLLNIDRLNSTLRPGVDVTSIHNWNYGATRKFDLTILLDRSMLEIYCNDTISGTARIYPHYGDSDYIRLVDENAGMKVTKIKITQMKSAYSSDGSITAPYYENTGKLGN